MAKQKDIEQLVIDWIRMVARFLGGVLFLMIIMFAVGEGIPNPFSLPAAQALTFFSFVVMLGGLILAWIREGIGGLIILIGYGIFIIVNPDSNLFGVVSIFPITALLFIIYWWKSGKKTGKNPRKTEA